MLGVIAAHYVAGGASTPPPVTAGLVAWYSPQAETGYTDNATMTGLTDRSGNGWHATSVSGTPKWRSAAGPGGGAAIEFVGNNQRFNFGNMMSGKTAGEFFCYIKASDASGVEMGFSEFGSHTDKNHYPFSDGSLYIGWGSTARNSLGAPPLAITSWRRLDIWSAASDWALYLDETLDFSTATNTVGWTTAPNIGNTSNSGGGTLTYGGILVYGRKLTTAERTDTITWLTANPSGGTP